jgi:hypothetical protein
VTKATFGPNSSQFLLVSSWDKKVTGFYYSLNVSILVFTASSANKKINQAFSEVYLTNKNDF